MPRSREAQRVAAAERYERYKQYRETCRQHGVEPRTTHWCEHHRELSDEWCRPSRDEMFAYWQSRFTDREIHEIAGCLDFLYSEGVAA